MTANKPAILSYCATFLPREMMHVYRQVANVRQFENWVVTRTRANPESFPFERLVVLRKSWLRAFSRMYYRSQNSLVPVGGSETRQMLGLIQEKHAVLAHIYLGSEALRLLNFLDRCPAARIVSFHGADLSQDYAEASYRQLWTKAERFLCRSESLKQLLIAKGCPSEKIRLNYTGVPVPESAVQKRLNGRRQSEPLRLLQACRFIAKKGLDVSLEAVKQLKDRGINITLTLAGEGPEEAALRALAERLGIVSQIKFAGFLSEELLRQAFESHDVFVHPSRTTATGDREGIPNALLEAMAWGMPVVSTHHSGIPEAVTDGDNGLLIDEAHAGTLAAAIERLVKTSDLFETLSLSAAHSITQRFSIARCVENLESIYAEAIAFRR